MTNKAVLYVSFNGIFDPVGQSQILPYLKGLALEGYKFRLVTFEKKDSLENVDVQRMKSQLAEIDIRWYALERSEGAGLFTKFSDVCKGVRLVLRLLDEKIDILHARSYVAALIIWIVMKFRKAGKSIFDMRGFMADEYADINYWRKKSFKYILTKYFERKFIKEFSYIVVLTEDAREMLRAFERTKEVYVIPCCVDNNFFTPISLKEKNETKKELGLDNKDIYVYSGSLAKWYLVEDMLKYFALLKKYNERAFLLVVTLDDKTELTALLRKHSISDFKIVAADISEMPRLIGIAELGLLFLKECMSKRASFPITLTEYLSCGIPVATTSFSRGIEKMLLDHRVGVICKNHGLNGKQYQEYLDLKSNQELEKRCRDIAIQRFSLTSVGIPSYANIYSDAHE